MTKKQDNRNNSWTPCPKRTEFRNEINMMNSERKKKFGEQGEDWSTGLEIGEFQELEWLLFSLKLVYIPVIKQPNPWWL